VALEQDAVARDVFADRALDVLPHVLQVDLGALCLVGHLYGCRCGVRLGLVGLLAQVGDVLVAADGFDGQEVALVTRWVLANHNKQLSRATVG
jgi:hypothetical protein